MKKRSQNLNKKVCGVYYLVDYVESGVVVLYVGAATDVGRRIKEHQRARRILFCDVFVDECKEEELWERQSAAIAEFRPRSVADCVADCADEAETYSKTPVVGSRAVRSS